MPGLERVINRDINALQKELRRSLIDTNRAWGSCNHSNGQTQMRGLLLGLISTLIMTPVAAAKDNPEPEFQGTHNAWRVFTRGAGGERICYALSTPTEELPASANHGEVFFILASWANGDANEQPNFLAGYSLRADNPPEARVGSSRFDMFVSEQEGFLEDQSDESRLVRSMRRGSVMRVEAVSTRGTATAYEFSLSGVTAALRQVGQLCS